MTISHTSLACTPTWRWIVPSITCASVSHFLRLNKRTSTYNCSFFRHRSNQLSPSADNRKESFLCGTGTMFNQEILSCDHKGKVNCADSPNFYEANTELGKPGAEPSSQPAQSGSKGSSAPAPAPRQQQPRPRVQQPSKVSDRSRDDLKR